MVFSYLPTPGKNPYFLIVVRVLPGNEPTAANALLVEHELDAIYLGHEMKSEGRSPLLLSNSGNIQCCAGILQSEFSAFRPKMYTARPKKVLCSRDLSHLTIELTVLNPDDNC